MDDQTNAVTAKAATEQKTIATQGTIVIGIMTAPNGPRALLRHANGRVDSVQQGDRTRAGTVQAIGEDRVVLNKRNKEVILRLPAG